MGQFDIPITRPDLPPLDEYVEVLRGVWESQMLSNFGPLSEKLAQVAVDILKVPIVMPVACGDVGLITTLKALGLPAGAPCYISNFTFASTINAAVWAGLKPVLVDIDPASYNITVDGVAERADRREPGAILATHVFGNPATPRAFERYAAESGNRLVFDAAHAFGSIHDGRAIGSFGNAEVFSLSGTKLVTTGEGGLIATRDHELAETIRHIRAYGFQYDYNSKFVGINGKMSEIHCALGLLTLPRYGDVMSRRAQIIDHYRQRLGAAVSWQAVQPGDVSTYKDLSLGLGPRRGAIEEALRTAGIETKRYFRPLHLQPAYEEFAGEVRFPNATAVYEETLCVPLYSNMTIAQADRVSDVILAHI